MRYAIPKDELYHYYVEQEMSTNDISLIYGCNNGTVYHRLKKYGIQPRTNKQASRTSTHKHGRVIDLPIDVLKSLYLEEKMPLKLIGKCFGCGKWLIGDRLKKAGVELRNRELSEFGRSVLWTPEVVAKIKVSGKRFWESMTPEQRANRLTSIAKGANRRPNIPEKSIECVLSRLYPGQWKYVGDGDVIINGRNPDFINTNGKKLIIEMFGDYWHTQRVRCYEETEAGRIAVYASYGYKTLVVWERDTKDNSKLEGIIADFVESSETQED